VASCADVPGGGAAHREAAHDDAVFVDEVVLFDRGERFEQIDFAGELVGVAVASVQVQHDRVARGELAGPAHAFRKEVDLAQLFGAAVEPGVQAPGARQAGIVGGRHDQAIGLHGTVDLRNVAAHDQARRARPGRFAVAQRLSAVDAFGQQRPRLGRLIGPEEFVVFERIADGIAEDNHIGQQGVVAEAGDEAGEPFDARPQLLLVGLGDGHPGRRNRPVLRQERGGQQGETKELHRHGSA